ncbi:hypothetical protein OE88DRAFT_1659670 [Heliocybe sulcata]|uniref:Uncharacterized protein n=1 Tax=Heliocybe sulcata TaxID=5364 RepID=A0A5C3N1G1_9AGAM|nr:hypothetical protein OE88DRAFT_1659670 [Heliocybe sulcata]
MYGARASRYWERSYEGYGSSSTTSNKETDHAIRSPPTGTHIRFCDETERRDEQDETRSYKRQRREDAVETPHPFDVLKPDGSYWTKREETSSGSQELRIKGASQRTKENDDEIISDSDSEERRKRKQGNSQEAKTASSSREYNGSTKSEPAKHEVDRFSWIWKGVTDNLGIGRHLSGLLHESPPASTQCISVSDAADLELETPHTTQDELLAVQAELGEANRKIAEYRAKEKSQTEELAEARHRMQTSERDKKAVITGFQDASTAAKRWEDQCLSAQKETAKFKHALALKTRKLEEAEQAYEARYNALLEEKGQLKREVKALKGKTTRSSADHLLDDFDSTVDQTSEMFIRSGASFSVESINAALDDFVVTVMEKAGTLAEPRGPEDVERNTTVRSVLGPLAQNAEVLEAALHSESHLLTLENRELLLDALLHDEVLKGLHRTFFSNDVAVVDLETAPFLDRLANEIGTRESWKVVQKWRSLTAVATVNFIDRGRIMDIISSKTEVMIRQIAVAYGSPHQNFDSIRGDIAEELRTLYTKASELSLVLRRDVMSVRLAVTIVRNGIFDGVMMDCQWSEMGVNDRDGVLGAYGLGLSKATADGQRWSLARPKVVTEALFREAGLAP